jgi:hypothetical protein
MTPVPRTTGWTNNWSSSSSPSRSSERTRLRLPVTAMSLPWEDFSALRPAITSPRMISVLGVSATPSRDTNRLATIMRVMISSVE